jgi:hypothetical protein
MSGDRDERSPDNQFMLQVSFRSNKKEECGNGWIAATLPTGKDPCWSSTLPAYAQRHDPPAVTHFRVEARGFPWMNAKKTPEALANPNPASAGSAL